MKRISAALLVVCATTVPGGVTAYTGLTPDDMTQMMRAMASMARIWNAFNQLGHLETYTNPSGFGFPYDPRTAYPATHRLQGIWQGRNGEIVTIQGNRLRIRSPSGQELDGAFMTYGNRLIAFCAQTNYMCRFNFEVRGELLALQNEAGDILLYRRLNRGRRW